MSNKQDDRHEAEALLEKVTAAYNEWDKNRPIAPNSNDRVIALMKLTALLISPNPSPEKREKYEAILNPEPDVIGITISPLESTLINQGLILLIQSIEAKHYIKESIGTNVTSEQRWSKVAEIMLIKEPGEKLSLHGSDEFCLYWALVKSGLSPRKASEGVFEKYKFNSQEACDKWLRREITRRQKETSHSIYDGIPKPGTSPRD
jgi:hypothetical protein